MEQTLCPQEKLSSLVSGIGTDQSSAMSDLGALLDTYPSDPRLHFLKGSLLAADQDYGAARESMRRAVDLAPDYAIARFQLGFLLLTSGEPYAAQETWGPLHALPAGNIYRVFATGLNHLIKDEFDDAKRFLREGISRNRENPALNGDMQLLIGELDRLKPGQGTSSVDFLLQQSAFKSTRH